MSYPAELSFETVDQVDEEHAQLRQLFLEIRRQLRHGPIDILGATAMMEELAERLSAHFAHEEDGGYLQSVIEIAPRLSQRVKALKAEHVSLQLAAETLAQQIPLAQETPIWWQAIRFEFVELARRCLVHEHSENALVQEAYTDDLGARD